MLLAVAVVPVAAAAVLAVEVQLARGGPRLPDVAHDFETGPADAPLAVWLGDSTAAGVGANDVSGTVPALVAAETGERLRVLAVSGATIEEMVEEQLPLLDELNPDRIYVSIGSNDVTHLTSRDDFRARYQELVSGLPRDVPLVLLGVPDMGSPPRLLQPLRAVAGFRGRQLDEVTKDMATATQRATYVDIAGHTGPPFRRAPDRYFSADKYHPNEAGYELWAMAVLEAIE